MGNPRNQVPKARLTLVVDFDDVPSDDDVAEILNKAKETGVVTTADVELLVPTKRNVLNLV